VTVTAGFEAIGMRFSVVSSKRAMLDRLRRVLGSLRTDAESEHEYAVEPEGIGVTLRFDREIVHEASNLDEAIAMLMWHVNREAAASRPDLLMVHSAAAVWEGQAILLPAREESGKTTLVAGLVRAGMGYLTDEAAALDLDADVVHSYPKPLTIEAGSWTALADLEPGTDAGRMPTQWLVDPRAIRADAVADAVPVGLVVSPRYEPGAPTTLAPLRRSETIAVLVENSFNFGPFGRRGLQALADIARRSDGYRLVSGDLASAVDAVFALAEKLREQACRPV
jgi:hypothetical protein